MAFSVFLPPHLEASSAAASFPGEAHPHVSQASLAADGSAATLCQPPHSSQTGRRECLGRGCSHSRVPRGQCRSCFLSGPLYRPGAAFF